jgi:hypothetical protein
MEYNKIMSKLFISSGCTRYIPMQMWNQFHPWPSVAGLRALVAKRKKNGFNKVYVKVGKRIVIDEKAFFDWMESRKKLMRGEE